MRATIIIITIYSCITGRLALAGAVPPACTTVVIITIYSCITGRLALAGTAPPACTTVVDIIINVLRLAWHLQVLHHLHACYCLYASDRT